jgi:hypothetical protein
LKDVADSRLYGEKYSSLLMALLHDWFPVLGTCVGSQHQAKLVDAIHRLPRYSVRAKHRLDTGISIKVAKIWLIYERNEPYR